MNSSSLLKKVVGELLTRDGKGWRPELFINYSDSHVCASCQGVCVDAVELACSFGGGDGEEQEEEEHDDQLKIYCRSCLEALIHANHNLCVINQHENPLITKSAAIRKQIKKLEVMCPNSVQRRYKALVRHGDDNKNGNGTANDRQVNMPIEGCTFKGTLDQFRTHINGCVSTSIKLALTRNETGGQRLINELAYQQMQSQQGCLLTTQLKTKHDKLTRLQTYLEDVQAKLDCETSEKVKLQQELQKEVRRKQEIETRHKRNIERLQNLENRLRMLDIVPELISIEIRPENYSLQIDWRALYKQQNVSFILQYSVYPYQLQCKAIQHSDSELDDQKSDQCNTNDTNSNDDVVTKWHLLSLLPNCDRRQTIKYDPATLRVYEADYMFRIVLQVIRIEDRKAIDVLSNQFRVNKAYLAKWSSVHKTDAIELQDYDQKAVCIAGYQTVRAVNGISKDMMVKIKFRIYLHNSDYSAIRLFGANFFGVVTNAKCESFHNSKLTAATTSDAFDAQLFDAYGIGSHGCVFLGNTPKLPPSWSVGPPYIRFNQQFELHMVVDFATYDSCVLAFYTRDGRLVCRTSDQTYSIKLPENVDNCWYPACSIHTGNGSWCRISTFKICAKYPQFPI